MLLYQDDLAPNLLSYRQCSLIQWLGLVVLALVVVEHCQIVQGCCCVRVIWPQHLLIYRQCSLIQWLGLVVLALVVVERCQIVQRCCCVRMIWPQTFSSIASAR